MYIGNVEGDELLTQICMSVANRKYSILLPSGAKYPLQGKYREGGRFSRKSVERQMSKLGKKLDSDYEIVLETDYDGKEDLAVMLLTKRIKALYYLTGCDRLDFYIGCRKRSNFRFERAVTQPYKGGREEKPALLEYLREYLIAVYGAIEAVGYEADDMLGIYQTSDTIAIHIDKDINMIPGRHWNTSVDKPWIVTEDEGFMPESGVTFIGTLFMDNKSIKGSGLRWFYAQMLLGDDTDNIPKLRKDRTLGDKGVFTLLGGLSTEEQLLRCVIDEFRKQPSYIIRVDGGDPELVVMSSIAWQERLYEQADLVWMCRNREEYGSDYIKRKIKEYNINV